jgi:hypothetical protein
VGNFPSPKKKKEESFSLLGDPGDDSNFEGPDEDMQEFAEGGEVDEGKKAAAEELMSAFKAGDTAGLVSALESFIAQCGESEPEIADVE